MEKAKVLIIDNEADFASKLGMSLKNKFNVDIKSDLTGLDACFKQYNLILLDTDIKSVNDGIDYIIDNRINGSSVEIIIMTPLMEDEYEKLVKKCGIYYLPKKVSEGGVLTLTPIKFYSAFCMNILEKKKFDYVAFETDRLLYTNNHIFDEPHDLMRHLELNNLRINLVSISPKIDLLKEKIKMIAMHKKAQSICILGESGVGKEEFAKFFHIMAHYRSNFIPINVPAEPNNLFESELFGHEKGAFTGADSVKKGKIELADGGTLFLDEIGDLPLESQVKLLRVLQEKTITRLGGTKPIKVDFRLVAATNANLFEKVRRKEFSEALLYRLLEFPLMIPPIRERSEDIRVISEYIINNFKDKRQTVTISDNAMAMLQQYPWPGNIRELSSILKRCIVYKNAAEIQINAEDIKKELNENLWLTKPEYLRHNVDKSMMQDIEIGDDIDEPYDKRVNRFRLKLLYNTAKSASSISEACKKLHFNNTETYYGKLKLIFENYPDLKEGIDMSVLYPRKYKKTNTKN